MKILQVIPYFTPKRGGDVNACYNISKVLSEKGHDVTIITTDFEFDNEYSKLIENYGVSVLKFKCLFNISLFLYSPSMKNWLKKNIMDFDIVHLHTYRTYQNHLLHDYATNYDIPYILQAHGSVPLIIEKQNLKKLFDIVWGNKIITGSSKLIAVSNVEVEQYKQFKLEENRIIKIPNGIDLEKFEMEAKKDNFKKLHDIQTEKMILFLGRLHKRKGLDFLIKSFEIVLRKNRDVNLVIVGPDEGYKYELEKISKSLEISDHIKFIDFVEKVNEAYIDADVLVYPAIYEIFGLVPFESILCGTPVIVTDDCGCGELIQNAECGYLVKYGDKYGLARMIMYVLNNPDETQKTVKNGKNYIYDNLDWRKIVIEMEKVYENCIRDF